MKSIILALFLIVVTAVFTGCTISNTNSNQSTNNTKGIILEEIQTGNIEDGLELEQVDEGNLASDYSLVINNTIVTLRDWDNNVDLQKIIGNPTSQSIEQLGNNADTLTGTYIKTLEYEGLHLKLASPKDNGKQFWIMEMVVSNNDYKTSRGITIGDKIEEVKTIYPGLEIALDGRTDPYNCLYIINNEQVEYLQFEVKEGLVTEIKILYVMQ